MGRKKINIQPIKGERNRSATFLKRKAGLFKKAHELAVLTDSDVAVLVFNRNGKLAEFCSGDMENFLLRYTEYSGTVERRGPEHFASINNDAAESESTLLPPTMSNRRPSEFMVATRARIDSRRVSGAGTSELKQKVLQKDASDDTALRFMLTATQSNSIPNVMQQSMSMPSTPTMQLSPLNAPAPNDLSLRSHLSNGWDMPRMMPDRGGLPLNAGAPEQEATQRRWSNAVDIGMLSSPLDSLLSNSVPEEQQFSTNLSGVSSESRQEAQAKQQPAERPPLHSNHSRHSHTHHQQHSGDLAGPTSSTQQRVSFLPMMDAVTNKLIASSSCTDSTLSLNAAAAASTAPSMASFGLQQNISEQPFASQDPNHIQACQIKLSSIPENPRSPALSLPPPTGSDPSEMVVALVSMPERNNMPTAPDIFSMPTMSADEGRTPFAV